MKNLLAGLFLLFLCIRVEAATYYVRADGGTTAQCSGLSNAAYPGSGSGQACAWHHPFDALPPQADTSTPPAVRVHGGDTLIIGAGTFEIGIHAPGASAYAACNQGWSWDCVMANVPSGTAAAPTRILGAGWDTGCKAPPQLWSNERATQVVSLDGSSNVVVGCLEITDHSNCIESHLGGNSPYACNRSSAPYGGWGPIGIKARDSNGVTLQDLHIHGLANTGILAGRLSNWTVNRVQLIANGWAGWSNDLGESAGSSNAGYMNFSGLEIGFSGCAEAYPGTQIVACWGQMEGGYGDGFGSAQTGGNWTFDNSYFHHNTQDGLDLLYANTQATIKVTHSHAEGNAGNQIKVAGSPTVENTTIVGNCAYFQGIDYMSGNNSGGAGTAGDMCRAMGNALVLSVQPSMKAVVHYDTIVGQGDCLILAVNGDATSHVTLGNNTLIGKPDWMKADQSPQPQSCMFYWDSGPSTWPVTYKKNLVWQVKDGYCPPGGTCNADPKLTNMTLSTFDALPLAGSPLINAADLSDLLFDDQRGMPRPTLGGYDIGSLQFQGTSDTTGSDTIFKSGYE